MSGLLRRLAARLPDPVRDRLRLAVAVARERRLRWTGAKVGLVLVYHRTGVYGGNPDRELDPAFPVALLRRQLDHLQRSYRPVKAPEILAAATRRRRGERFPAVVTLDDDLRSHLTVAAPLLRELSIPATAFLTCASLDGEAGFWWNDLQRAVDLGLLAPGDLPGVEPALVESAVRGEQRAIRRLARSVEGLGPGERDAIGRRLHEIAGSDGSEPALSREDVPALAEAGVAIGFHTLHHYDLRTLDDEALTAAMRDGRAELELAAGHPPAAIAYLHGKCDERVADAARAAGFRLGFTGEAKAVHVNDDPLRLGRLQPARGSLAEFALQLTTALRSAAA